MSKACASIRRNVDLEVGVNVRQLADVAGAELGARAKQIVLDADPTREARGGDAASDATLANSGVVLRPAGECETAGVAIHGASSPVVAVVEDPVSVQDLRGRGRRIRRKRKRILQLAIQIYLAAVLGRLWAAHCLRMWTARVDERSDSGDSDSSDSDDSSCSDGSESDEDDASESNDKHQAGHSATGLPCIIVRDYSNGSPVDQEFESFMAAVRAFQSLKLKCRRAELVMNGVVKESFG